MPDRPLIENGGHVISVYDTVVRTNLHAMEDGSCPCGAGAASTP